MSYALNGSVLALISSAENAFDLGRVNDSLCIIHDFVERIITEPICAAQVFASHDLDQLCLRIGRGSLTRLSAREADPWPDRGRAELVVYLVSRLQNSGGHARLLKDFIRAQPEKNHLILSTEVGGPSDREYLALQFEGETNVRLIYAPRHDFQSRLDWGQSMLLATQPEHVYLLNHHQDCVAVAMLVPELRLNGTFVHHADHHICLGVHMSHLVHLDLHPMGYHYCRNELGINNRYLPLTVEDKHLQSAQTEFMSGGCLTTATVARSNKVEIPYYVSYVDFIPQMLKVTGGRHIHIGKLTPGALRRIQAQMRKKGVQKDRFVYVEWVPSVWKALQEHQADIYIASFPYGAGLTLIEAMGAGVPVIMHKHMYSRVLSSLELAYPGAFAWADPEDLIKHLGRLSSAGLEREKRLSRHQYETFHRPELLQAYLQDPDAVQLPVPPLSDEFRPRHDEWAAWAVRQLSFHRVLYRFAYRAFRKFRARWL